MQLNQFTHTLQFINISISYLQSKLSINLRKELIAISFVVVTVLLGIPFNVTPTCILIIMACDICCNGDLLWKYTPMVYYIWLLDEFHIIDTYSNIGFNGKISMSIPTIPLEGRTRNWLLWTLEKRMPLDWRRELYLFSPPKFCNECVTETIAKH